MVPRIIPFCFLFLCVLQTFAEETDAVPQFTPGELTVIPPSIDFEDVARRNNIPELLATVPEFKEISNDIRFNKDVWAKKIRYNKDIWCLQFSFKPLRIVEVEMIANDGKLEKKAVWYLVYNVKNLGKSVIKTTRDPDKNTFTARVETLNSYLGSAVYEGQEYKLPVAADNTSLDLPRNTELTLQDSIGRYEPTEGSGKPIQFQPQFVLTIHKLTLDTQTTNHPETARLEYKTQTASLSYNDRIIPLALPAIIRREGFKAIPETSVSFPLHEIAAGQDRWGVAMWTDIDPRISDFSVYVSGLTNAYQQFDAGQNSGKIGEGRILKRRVLKTDWWRIGDKYLLSEQQIRFGYRDEPVKLDIFALKGDFNRDGKVDKAEFAKYKELLLQVVQLESIREKIQSAMQPSDLEGFIVINDFERAAYNRILQQWLQPTYGYEWLYLN